MPELDPSTPSVKTVAAGIARIGWGRGEQIDDVRRVVELALTTHARVEAWVDPEDPGAQRVATWSGLRREGVMRGVTVDGGRADRIVYARLSDDRPADDPEGFRALLNSFLPRKRAIAQMLVRDATATGPDDQRVLLCRLTYKSDWDLPGGVVEVGESPQDAVAREVTEELALDLPAGQLLLTDWLPPWSGWDDALCLVFDGGEQDPRILDRVVRQEREIRDVAFCTVAQARERCADFTARRVEAALANVVDTALAGYSSQPGASTDAPRATYVESGRAVGRDGVDEP